MPPEPRLSKCVEGPSVPAVSSLSTSDLSIAVTREYDSVAALPDSYSQLFLEASRRSIFFSQPWFHNLDQTVVDELYATKIYGVELQQQSQHDRPIGAFLLRTPRLPCRATAPREVHGLSNYYTALYGPVLGEKREESNQAIYVLTGALCKDRGAWDVLNLRPLDVTDAIYTGLSERFRAAGLIVQSYFCFGNWYLDVQGRSYADYLGGLSSILKKNIPYYTRKLERTAAVRYELITSQEGLEQGLHDFVRIYNLSWRDKAEPYPSFIPGLVRAFAQQGWLRLGLIYLNDEPAAAQLWLTHHKVASIYKICYDQKFAKLSVGTVLTARMMQHALDIDKVWEVDYLGGDEPYKRDWMPNRRERWGLMIFNPSTIRGLGQIIRHVGGREIKRLCNRLVPNSPPSIQTTSRVCNAGSIITNY